MWNVNFASAHTSKCPCARQVQLCQRTKQIIHRPHEMHHMNHNLHIPAVEAVKEPNLLCLLSLSQRSIWRCLPHYPALYASKFALHWRPVLLGLLCIFATLTQTAKTCSKSDIARPAGRITTLCSDLCVDMDMYIYII